MQNQPALTDNRYKIYGTARGAYQQPLAGTTVKAFDKDIRSEQLLGETKTNEQGYHEIFYMQEQFAVTDKQAADVLVRVYDAAEGKENAPTVLKESPVYYNAPAQLQVDISLSDKLYKGLSEFEQMIANVTPFTGQLPLS